MSMDMITSPPRRPAPTYRDDMWRSPATWVFIAGVLYGGWQFTNNFLPVLQNFPGAATTNVFFLALSLVIGLWLARRIFRPVQAPPWNGTVLAVLWGGTAATGIALAANSPLSDYLTKAFGFDFSTSWGAAFTAPLNEETAKLLGVLLLAAMSSRLVRTPADGFAYGALVGLGFLVAENVTYALNAVLSAGGVGPAIMSTLVTGTRLGLTVWGSHWAMSAVAGAGVGYLVARWGVPLGRRVLVAAGCWVLAMAMHFQFNSPAFEGYAWGGSIKATINLVVAVSVFIVVRRAFRRRWAEAVQEEVDSGALLRMEAMAIGRRHSRSRYRRHYSQPGRQRHLLTLLQKEQLELLEDRTAGEVAEKAAWKRGEIDAVRTAMGAPVTPIELTRSVQRTYCGPTSPGNPSRGGPLLDCGGI
ncbi:PrsW family intramembrane metalloprotease [Salininema proteolyticum]|uniref:PrsW family intramembrane metalloprotease n=1 Tax=Salininema proteolyticum TaxID=1607685 RepID=A0ABV8U0R9_9ACTN